MLNFPLLPEQASTFAPQVDAAFYFMTAFVLIFAIAVTVVLVVLGIRYRQEPGRPSHHPEALQLEILWTIIPAVLAIAFFGWGAKLFFDASTIPEDAYNIEVIGKQWMWKMQHPNGRQEVNELHVPVNQPIRLSMISKDVIHSFFVPAFRKKQDVLPGRRTYMWFEATKVGSYPLFCAEYCGTDHSTMVGTVHVMERQDYLDWLDAGAPAVTPAAAGEALFNRHGCATCHHAGDEQRGPSLIGLYRSQVALADGSAVTADEEYIRESILDPGAKVVAGYAPLMPEYRNQLSPEDVTNLVAYIKSLDGN